MKNGAKKLTGVLRKGARTKDLVKRLRPGELALIRHQDLDPVAAEALVGTEVACVLNASPSMSGRYPNGGPRVLLEGGVPLLDVTEAGAFDETREGAVVVVDLQTGTIAPADGGGPTWSAHVLSADELEWKTEQARENLRFGLRAFVQNTLDYVTREDDILIDSMPVPDLQTEIAGRHALVAVRGEGYRKDLGAIRSYLAEVRPVLIAVDGGADALIELGFRPHLIVGDMDSVSDEALRSGAEIIVHGYPGRDAPGMARLEQLGLAEQAQVLEAPGTSEDVAMLLAYEKGASLIVAVGTHSTMTDFLDKGRPGMASTFLTRLKVGNLLVDAKGVRHLYGRTVPGAHLGILLLVGLFAALIIVLASPSVQSFLQLVGYRFFMFLRSVFGLGF